MSYLRYLCLLANSGVQHILCCVLLVFVLCTLYCQFLLIAPSVFSKSNIYLRINYVHPWKNVPSLSFVCVLPPINIFTVTAAMFDNLQSSQCTVINVTFNNILVISWWSVLLVEDTEVPGENHRPTANWQTLSHNVVSNSPRLCGIQTHKFRGDRY